MLQRTDFYPSKRQKTVTLNQQYGEKQSHFLHFSKAFFWFSATWKRYVLSLSLCISQSLMLLQLDLWYDIIPLDMIYSPDMICRGNLLQFNQWKIGKLVIRKLGKLVITQVHIQDYNKLLRKSL